MIAKGMSNKSDEIEAGPMTLVESGGQRFTVALMGDHTLSERKYSQTGDLIGSKRYQAAKSFE